MIIGIATGMVIAYLVNDLHLRLKERCDRKVTVRKSIEQLDRRMKIKSELSALRVILDADRVSIIAYNNTDESASMQYESVSYGVPEIIQSFQNIKSTKLIPMLYDLEKRGSVIVDKNSGAEVRHLHEAIGISTSYKYKILNTINEGCLVIAFEKDVELDIKQVDIVFQSLKTLKQIYAN